MNVKRLFLSALLPLGFASLGMAQLQTVKMTTAKPVGSAVVLALNRTTGVTLDWGDGKPVEYAAGDNRVMIIEGTTKGKELVLTVGGNLEMLTCSNAGLTALDVSAATMLRSLYCQNNELTSLDLSAHKKLSDLNCSGNKLTTKSTTDLSETNFPAMETLNISGNEFDGTFKLGKGTLQQLNVSNNKLTNLYVTNNPALDVLNCGNNTSIKTLYLTANTVLSAVVCQNAAIGKLSVPVKGLESLNLLLIDDNKLTKLDLADCPNLKDVSCRNNQLEEMALPANTKLNSLDCSHNKLLFRHLPVSSKKPKQLVCSPQADVVVTEDMKKVDNSPYIDFAPSWEERENTDYVLDLSDYRYDAGGKRTTVEFTWYSVDYSKGEPVETELTEATNSDKEHDYYLNAGKTTFLKGYENVYGTMTSRTYSDLVIKTNVFTVGKDKVTGIENVESNGGFRLSASAGVLTMSSNAPTATNVCTASGKTVWQGTVGASAVSVKLPKGVYIVNGKKILL